MYITNIRTLPLFVAGWLPSTLCVWYTFNSSCTGQEEQVWNWKYTGAYTVQYMGTWGKTHNDDICSLKRLAKASSRRIWIINRSPCLWSCHPKVLQEKNIYIQQSSADSLPPTPGPPPEIADWLFYCLPTGQHERIFTYFGGRGVWERILQTNAAFIFLLEKFKMTKYSVSVGFL
jgi:hypothetical protein